MSYEYERAESPGGVWAKTYPSVTLQNTAPQYHISDFPWPFEPDLHPTAEQIRRYIDLAIAHSHRFFLYQIVAFERCLESIWGGFLWKTIIAGDAPRKISAHLVRL